MFNNNAVATTESAMSTLILKGDIGKLTDTEKVGYYKSICERLGLDPLTKPFDYLVLQGKQTLYLNKSGAEQLSKIHGVSMTITDSKKLDDIYVVTARAEQVGRHNDSTGAVTIKGLYGDALCNAMMKAETKAKRRATIGLLGLAMLDETEVETIPNATKVLVQDVDMETGEVFQGKTGSQKSTGRVKPGDHPGLQDTKTMNEPDWEELVIVGKEFRWPAPFVRQWVNDKKKEGLTTDDIYTVGMAKFSIMNKAKQETREEAEV